MENEKKDLQLVQNEIDTINKELQITEQMVFFLFFFSFF